MFSFLSRSENLNCAYPVVKETIPKSSLGYNTNNKYEGFPPLMSDGRSITASWQPEAVINNDMIVNNNIKTNWEYRQYLIHNSKEIINYNFTEASNDVGYYKRYTEAPKISEDVYHSTPYLYSSIMDDKKVLGVKNSDLKQLYLSREQLESRKVSPVITQDQLLSNAK